MLPDSKPTDVPQDVAARDFMLSVCSLGPLHLPSCHSSQFQLNSLSSFTESISVKMAILLNSLAALQFKAGSFIAVIVILIALVAVAPLLGRLAPPRGAPRAFGGHGGLNSPTFTKSRNKYLRHGKEQSPDKQFSFWHGPNHMVSVSGDVARTVFLTSRKLNALAAYGFSYLP